MSRELSMMVGQTILTHYSNGIMVNLKYLEVV